MRLFVNTLIFKICFFLILFEMASPLFCIAGENQLYLLTGCPTPKSDVKFPSTLYITDASKKAFVQVRNVVLKDEGSEFIGTFNDKHIVMIETKSGSHSEGKLTRKFALLNMSTPLLNKTFEISYPDSLLDIRAHLFDIPKRGLYQSVYVVGSDVTKTFMLLGVNLSTMKQEELPLDVYKYVRVSGIPGGALPGDVFVASARADGQIMIPTVKGKIESEWKLPAAIKVGDNERIAIYVNNDDMLALILSESRVKKKTGLGYTPFHILDKKTNKWHSVEFQGGRTGVRGFGLWLVGYVSDEERGIDNPGRAKRRKDMTATGTPVDWRFKDFKIYCPGTLFLYNVQTMEKYTIETGQGDSEVLLVEGDSVYYRVNDEIYQAKIGKNRVEAGTLLVKGEVVPDIHWAFLGPQ